tara:strand:- start:722 stop:1183 length:462 start_codon:yes stop_codon:yes gene_type:complete
MFPKFARSPVPLLTEIILLALMMWPAPIPVGHRHSEYSSRVSDHQMACHLAFYHGGFSNSENWPNDWHWHWVYPAEHGGQTDVDNLRLSTGPMVVGRPLVPLAPPQISMLDCVQSTACFVRPSIPCQRQHSFQGAALLRSRQSLPELLGVIRC